MLKCSQLASNNLTAVADVPRSNCCPTIVHVGPTVAPGLFYWPNKTVPADDIVGCDSGAAGPAVRERYPADAGRVGIQTGTPESDWTFDLTIGTDPAGRPTLIVKSKPEQGAWGTDLAFTCCRPCPAGTVSRLEELDLSNNLLSGPPPLSFEKLKTSLLKLNLTYNNFAGDYSRLADLERNSNTKFLRTDGLSLGVEIKPQRPCSLDTYAKAHEGAHDDLPSCELVPVRLKRCLPRSDATRHNLTSYTRDLAGNGCCAASSSRSAECPCAEAHRSRNW